MIIGPWTHYGTFQQTAPAQITFPANAIFVDDIISIVRDWFDLWLKGGKARGGALAERRRVYLMGAVGEPGCARATAGSSCRTGRRRPRSSRCTSTSAAAWRPSAARRDGELELVADPANPVPTSAGRSCQQRGRPLRPAADRGAATSLSFTTAALERRR